jgi:hypothetical protein
VGIEYATVVPLQVGAGVFACAAWSTLRMCSRRDPTIDVVLRCSKGFFGATCLTSLAFPAVRVWSQFGAIDLGMALWIALLLVAASALLFTLFAVAVLLLLVGAARQHARRAIEG